MEMLQKQFASPVSGPSSVTSVSPKVSSSVKASPAKASATVTSASEYTSEAVEIAEAVRVAVESKKTSGGYEKPTDKGSSTSGAAKRGRVDSRSPPPSKKKFSKGASGLTAQLRQSEAEWQDRAARAEEDLKKVRADYRALDKQYRDAKTKWETDRTRLVADRSTAEAEAAEQKDAADKAVEASREARQKLAELQQKLDQVTSDHEALRARDRDWENEKKAMAAHIVTLTDEVEKWRRDACYRLPNGKMQLIHRPSYLEILWDSKGSLPARTAATETEREEVWRSVIEVVKTQLRDLQRAWTFIDGCHKADPNVDIHNALYSSTKVAIQEINAEVVRQLGDKVAGRRPGKTLAEDLTGLQVRSLAKVEVHELDTSTAQNAEVVALREQLATARAELKEANKLVDLKTRDCSTMHSYGSRHADCLRSMAGSLQTVAHGLLDLLQGRAEEQDVPSEVRESRDLEESVEQLQGVLASVGQRSEPISMKRRQLPPLPAIPTTQVHTNPLLTAASLAVASGSAVSTATATVSAPPRDAAGVSGTREDGSFRLETPPSVRTSGQQRVQTRRSPRVAGSSTAAAGKKDDLLPS